MKNPLDYHTYLGLVELLVQTEPGYTVRKLARTTGIEQYLIDDAVYELMQVGVLKLNNDSTLSWCGCPECMHPHYEHRINDGYRYCNVARCNCGERMGR